MTDLKNANKLEICRLCLHFTINKISIFKDDFSKMIEMLTCLKVKVDDDLPKISCLKCARDVKTAFLLRRRIIQSYKVLNSNINYVANNRSVNHRMAVANIPSSSSLPTEPEQDLEIIEPENQSASNILASNIPASSRSSLSNKNQIKIEPDRILSTSEVQSHDLLSEVNNSLNKLKNKYANHYKQKVSSWKMMNKRDQLHIIKWLEKKKVNSRNLTSRLASTALKKREPLNMYCAQCQIKFNNKISYKNHMTRHKHKTCPICDKQIRSTYLKKHMTLHEEAPVVCEICGQTCKNACSLRMHFFYYHKNPNFCVCEDCGRSFRTKTKLLYHQRKDHTKERNYKCETCGKSFFLRIYLTKHINMKHMKLRPHICEYCGKGFSGRHALRTHVRQHTNESPYHCTLCEEKFKQRVSLRGHLKSRHNVEEENSVFCEVCGKGFVSEIALDVHSRLHSEMKCPFCTDTFADKTYLEQHVNTLHTRSEHDNPDGEFKWMNL